MFARQLAGVQGRIWVQIITCIALYLWSFLPCLGKNPDFADISLWSYESLPKETAADGRAVKSA